MRRRRRSGAIARGSLWRSVARKRDNAVRPAGALDVDDVGFDVDVDVDHVDRVVDEGEGEGEGAIAAERHKADALAELC